MELFLLLISALFWGTICYAVGKAKNIKGFWWGFWLGFIGLIIVLCLHSKNDTPQINASNTSKDDSGDKYLLIEKLSELKDSGALSNEEYEAEKSKLLA